MPTPVRSQPSQTPRCAVLINNGRMDYLIERSIKSITVTEDLEAPSMVVITLGDLPRKRDFFRNKEEFGTYADHPQLNPGNEIEIKLGYDSLHPVIVGEITGLEPEFLQVRSLKDWSPTITVRGHDRRHRLLRGTQTHSFVKLKDSQIAQEIASRNGLRAKVTDTQEILEYVLQNNLSDLAFLQARAQRIGYEVWIEGKTLHFQPPQYRTMALTRFSIDLPLEPRLLEFSPRLSLLNQVPQLEVRGWDWKNKQGIVSKSVANRIASMSGSQTGAEASRSAFGDASRQIVDQPVQSKAEADAIAQGQFEDMALHYITGEGTCVGDSKIRAGSVIEIKRVGKRFSGRYYVVAVTHDFSYEAGYRTEFTVRRTAG